jgi:hypothetical protein
MGKGGKPEFWFGVHAAFVVGPDGHNIEAVCHQPES